MAKVATTGILDQSLDLVNTYDRMAICAGQPADPSAIAAATLGVLTLTPGGFTKGAGTPSGRELAIAAQTGISITVTGDADHVVLYLNAEQGAGNNMLVTTAALRSLANGDTVSTTEYKFTIQAPT